MEVHADNREAVPINSIDKLYNETSIRYYG